MRSSLMPGLAPAVELPTCSHVKPSNSSCPYKKGDQLSPLCHKITLHGGIRHQYALKKRSKLMEARQLPLMVQDRWFIPLRNCAAPTLKVCKSSEVWRGSR